VTTIEHSEQGILELVRAYLLAQDASPFVVPGLREGERIFALAGRDSHVKPEIDVESLRLTDRTHAQATVEAAISVAVQRGEKTLRRSAELTIRLVADAGWHVADVIEDGVPLTARGRHLRVEPAECEGFVVEAHAVDRSVAQTDVALAFRNHTDRVWTLRCVGVQSRGRALKRLAEFSRGKLSRETVVDFAPGSEHGLMLLLPAHATRLWVKVKPKGTARTFIFAVSVNDGQLHPPRVPLRGRWRSARKPLLAAGIPFAALAVVFGVRGSLSAAAVFALVCYPLLLLNAHICVVRLERKLARLRATG